MAGQWLASVCHETLSAVSTFKTFPRQPARNWRREAIMVQGGDFSVFEYVYRDAGNWKTYGALLLAGSDKSAEARILESLDSGNIFVAEQVSIPALCQKHWKDFGDGPSDMDHAFHEFVCLRSATVEDRELFRVETTLEILLQRFCSATGRWDVRLSPNCFI